MLEYDSYLISEIIKSFLEKNGIKSYEYRHINEIKEKISYSGAVNLPENKILIIKQGILSFFEDNVEKCEDIELDINGINIFNKKTIKFSKKSYLEKPKINNLLYYKALDYDKIKDTLIASTRRPSDEFKGKGKKTKTLKKLFNQSKIPAHLRDNILIIRCAGEIVFIEGFGVSEKFCADQDTKNVLIISVEKNI